MSWFYLFLAGVFEVLWAIGLKFSHGFTRPLISAVTIGGMALSFYLLSLAIRTLPLGSAYAIWTGIGAVGTVIAGIVLFKEPATAGRLLGVACILIGIISLKLTNPE